MKDRTKSMLTPSHVLMFTGLLCCIGTALAGMPPIQEDSRTEVKFPPMMRENFLGNMRDHLAAISEIQAALGQGNFKLAADIAKSRLGMDAPSSMACKPVMNLVDGMAHMNGMSPMNEMTPENEMTKYMPEGMRTAGRAMHRAADQFAADAGAGDYRAVIASLAKVTQACASCHAHYRVR